MLFSESMCFFKKTKPVPPPLNNSQIQEIRPWDRQASLVSVDSTLPPTRPVRAYSNNRGRVAATTPTSSESLVTDTMTGSWMRNLSLGSTSSRSASMDSTASGRSILSLATGLRKKSVPEPVQVERPSIWTHHSSGEPRTVFKNAGRDEKGRLRLEYKEYDEVEW